jgi:hypothetical protein
MSITFQIDPFLILVKLYFVIFRHLLFKSHCLIVVTAVLHYIQRLLHYYILVVTAVLDYYIITLNLTALLLLLP